jgi:phosphoglycolate phosphatase (TIGR01487 family)
MIKAVAIDIDGTLTDEHRQLDLGAVAKARELEAMGVPVILATGNILCITESASFFIGTTGPLIAENGGIVTNPKTGEAKYHGDIEKVKAAFVVLEKKMKVERVMRSELRKTEIAIFRTVPVEDIKEALKDHDVGIVDTKFAIHIKDPKVNKGEALKEAAGMLGIDASEIAAIGDSENDREMLKVAGYAISVSEEGLKDVADYVTKGSFGEGCVEAVEHLIGEKKFGF